jgi:hypothetical protein
MLDLNLSRAMSAGEESASELLEVRAKLVGLIVTRAPETLDRYADLRSQAQTRAASDIFLGFRSCYTIGRPTAVILSRENSP